MSATLSAVTPGVIVTQADSTYPPLDAGVAAANNTPFEISTLSSLVCGAPVGFVLKLTTEFDGSIA